ncbi:hypothetical protein D3C72_1688940 [compost metagenome]
MALLELLGAGLERSVAALDQLVENALHLLLTGQELLPVLIQIGWLFAAQQHVLPLLDLNLELQIGLVNQLRSLQWPVDQLPITAHAGRQQLKADQSDHQYRQQAATK